MIDYTEDDLLKNGFTEKDVVFLKVIIERGRENGVSENFSTLLHDLRQRLYTNIFLLIVFVFIYFFNISHESKEVNVAYLIAMTVVLSGMFFINPLKLMIKSYWFLKIKGR